MRKIFFYVRNFLAHVMVWLFSLIAEKDQCEICNKECGKFTPVCMECERRFYNVNLYGKKVCSVCGKRLVSEDKICMECRSDERTLFSTDGVYPLFPYLLWNKNLLVRWKINGERRYSEFFAKLIYERILDLEKTEGRLIVVPVPPRHGKIREKGWDQIEDLCKFLEWKHGVKVMRLLQRNSDVQQKKLDRVERLKTINKAYSVKPGTEEFPEKVCLIDDVMTTGATIESCGYALKQAGVNKFFAITLFYVG